MIKVIAADMDGTLLNSKRQISEGNIKAIKIAEEKGIKFVIATGRSYDMVKDVADKYNLDCEYVLMNGAEYRDSKGNIIDKINLDNNKVKDIIRIMHNHGISERIFTNDGMYTTCTVEECIKGFTYQIMVLDSSKTFEEAYNEAKDFPGLDNIRHVDNLDEFVKSGIEIRKIIGFHVESKILDDTKNEIEALGELAILSSFATNIEVTDIKAQKGYILGEVVDKMGISRDDVMVLGDSFNDYTLFTEFKNCFAMENAMEHIKEIATYITDTNDNDGVAKAIYKMIGM